MLTKWARVMSKVVAKDGDDEFSDFLNVVEGGGGTQEEGNTNEETPNLDETDNEVEVDFRAPLSTEEDGDQTTGEEEPDGEIKDQEEETVDETPDIISELKAQNEKLMEIVNNIAGKKEEAFVEPPEEISDPFDSELYDKFVETMNWDDEESTAFKAFFKDFASYNNDRAINKALKETPTLITNAMTQKERVTALRDNFYKENPALIEVQDYVQLVATQINKNNPNLGVKEVLDNAAKVVYERLNINKDIVENVGEKAGKSKKPAFPKSPGARKPAPKQSEQDKEFNAMLALDDY